VFAIVRKETDRIYFYQVYDNGKGAKIDVCAQTSTKFMNVGTKASCIFHAYKNWFENQLFVCVPALKLFCLGLQEVSVFKQ
jgi:hypothetical protein